MTIIEKTILDLKTEIDLLKQRVSDLESRKRAEKGHLFKDSPYYDKDVFITRFLENDYHAPVDAEYYYYQVKAWAEGGTKKGTLPKKQNWLMVGRKFAQSDVTTKGGVKTISNDRVQGELGQIFRNQR